MQIFIKTQFFDHFILSHKLILNLQSQAITLDQFKDLTSKVIQQQDAEIIFLFHQLALENEPIFDKKITDLRSLKLFLLLQNYVQAARNSLFENVNISDPKYQERSTKITSNSPQNSPRGKTMRQHNQQTELQQIMQFVKNNFKDFLKCISQGDQISQSEFNCLQLILTTEKAEQKLLSSLFEKQKTLPINLVHDYCIKNLTIAETGAQSVYNITGFSKSVTIKTQVGQNIKISQCEDTQIFIESAVNTLCITQCINCQIYVSAVKLITTINSCEKIQVCVASNTLMISNSIDSTIHYFGTFHPILYGDSRNIVLAPHNGNVFKTIERCLQAQIPLSRQNRDRFINPIMMGTSKIQFQLLQAEEFYKFIVPEEFGYVDASVVVEGQFELEQILALEKKPPQQLCGYQIPLLATPEYQRQIYDRQKYFGFLQTQIKQSNIKEDYLKGLQNAIQGNFREWLVTSGATKQLIDLVKLIDEQ